MKKLFVLATVIALLGLSTAAMAAPVLKSGYEATSKSLGSVRYKDLAGTNSPADIYLGIDGLSTATNRVEQTFYNSGGNWQSTNYIEFIYDKANDKLITNVTNSRPTPYQLVWSNFSTTRPDNLNPAALNYLQIGMKSGGTGTVALTNILLDGASLGSISTIGWNDWCLSGYDFSKGFKLSADMTLTNGTFGSNENGKINITFGNDPTAPAAVPEASTLVGFGSALAMTGPGMIGWLRRRRA
jgi:hypothetical protein